MELSATFLNLGSFSGLSLKKSFKKFFFFYSDTLRRCNPKSCKRFGLWQILIGSEVVINSKRQNCKITELRNESHYRRTALNSRV